FFQAEDGIRDFHVTGVQTCALPISWHLLRGNDSPALRKMLSIAMWMALLVAPVQALVGDMHGLNTLEHQPAKIAAMEGHWENRQIGRASCRERGEIGGGAG